MQIKYSPQRSNVPLTYDFSGEQITAHQDGATDTFDFSSVPQGRAESFDSMLDPCPVLNAERDADGVLWVVLRSHIGPNATEAERFPDWETM